MKKSKSPTKAQRIPAGRVESPSPLNDAMLDRIAIAIKATGVSGTAALEGSRLTQFWIEELGKFDAQFPTVGAEIPFFIILEKYTIVVGVMDRLALDAEGLLACEWKSTKGTTKFWNEEKWIEQIRDGTQISVYGLGQHEGHFVPKRDAPLNAPGDLIRGEITGPTLWQPGIKQPRILVRAITKEDPPNLWGIDPPAFFTISEKRLKTVREALLLKADMIRAARTRKSVPWQLTGLQCHGHFFKDCRFLESCKKGEWPSGQDGGGHFNEDDPGGAALLAAQSLMRVPITDERVVVLSASAYSDATDCMELYRRSALEGSEENSNLDVGTALHAGLASWYESMIPSMHEKDHTI